MGALSGPQRARILALADRARASSTDLIDRDEIWEAKGEALAILFGVPRTRRRQRQFDRYVRSEGQGLVDFATWCALVEELGMPWGTWPKDLQDPRSAAVEEFRTEHEETVEFHMWLQWQIRQQLQAAQQEALAAGMTIGVVHDLAVGVHPDGSDAWALGDALVHLLPSGALTSSTNRPELGATAVAPGRLAELGYAPYRDMLRTVLRDSGGIRIDHILGLFRLWWIPQGMSPKDGTYVGYDSAALIGILALEAHRVGAIVIGEDLGVVAPTLRETMLERGIHGTSILWFEWKDSQFLPPEAYRQLCMATVTTHDLPPSAGYLTLEHVAVRGELGLLENTIEEKAAEARSQHGRRSGGCARAVAGGTTVDSDSSMSTTWSRRCMPTWCSHRLASSVSRSRTSSEPPAIVQPDADKEYPN